MKCAYFTERGEVFKKIQPDCCDTVIVCIRHFFFTFFCGEERRQDNPWEKAKNKVNNYLLVIQCTTKKVLHEFLVSVSGFSR